MRTFEAFSALSVGNGAFAFTADATGLQTFADEYHDNPLAIQAKGVGTHSPICPAFRIDDAMVSYDAHGRSRGGGIIHSLP